MWVKDPTAYGSGLEGQDVEAVVGDVNFPDCLSGTFVDAIAAFFQGNSDDRNFVGDAPSFGH